MRSVAMTSATDEQVAVVGEGAEGRYHCLAIVCLIVSQ
jgi:hypothetical protein